MIRIAEFAADWVSGPFAHIEEAPWAVTSSAPQLVATALRGLSTEFEIEDEIAVHRSAEVESGVVIKGPAIVGANARVASGAYLRGGIFVGDGCIVGPACELKSTFMLQDSRVAHLNFIGDSILGTSVNIEAGAMIANYRNELGDKRIRFVWRGVTVDTNVEKFGALVGDGSRIGANAVVAPGAVLDPGSHVPRLGHIDQWPPGT